MDASILVGRATLVLLFSLVLWYFMFMVANIPIMEKSAMRIGPPWLEKSNTYIDIIMKTGTELQ
ncbi:MAG: hypothetical protein IH946_07555 [Bacteroidetes bacterium]|nr:hypothetical protein [Bacteroidota bacterium]